MYSLTRPITGHIVRRLTREITELLWDAAGGVAAFSPTSLFTGGFQGAWYDFSDMSTLFQDSAGTTPVTAVEQPIGLVLDKSQGLVLGSELVTNGTFDTDNSGWTLTGGTAAVSGGVLTLTNVTTRSVNKQSLTTAVGQKYRITVAGLSKTGAGSTAQIRMSGVDNFAGATPLTSNSNGVFWYTATATTTWLYFADGGATIGDTVSVDSISVKADSGTHAIQATSAKKPTLSARKNLLLATNTMSTQNVTTAATPYTLTHTGTGTITLSGTSTAGPLVGAGTLTFTPTAGTLTLTVSGTVTNAQLEYGSVATAYQRVTTATDYDTVSFPHYAKFDGVDDVIKGISATAWNDMFVSIGYAQFTGIEPWSTNTETANASNFSKISGNVRLITGNGIGATVTSTASPTAIVEGGTVLASSNSGTARRNGVLLGDLSPAGTGTGSFKSITFGANTNQTGNITGINLCNAVILGRTPTAGEITSTEQFIASKSGITL